MLWGLLSATLSNFSPMIKILFRNALRSLIKQMPYSFINILGMTIGLASVIILILWISIQVSFDKFHKDQDRLYKVGMIVRTPNREDNDATINAPAGPEYKLAFPAVEQMVRFDPRNESVKYNDRFTRVNIYYSDSTFFDMFSFDLAKGDKLTCLNSPTSIVLTENAAFKVFGKENPLGKVVLISGNPFVVTAIAKNPPVNTSMQFDCIAPLSIIIKHRHVGWDGGLTCHTYLKLIRGTSLPSLQKQILVYMDNAINKEWKQYGYAMLPYIQALADVHLNAEAENELDGKGNKTQVFIFSGIGLLILIIACFNFVNISTAVSFRRTKEVSVKKIFGSDRKHVILFFVTESAVAILISLVLAFLLVKLLIFPVSAFIGSSITLSGISTLGWLFTFGSLFLFCTIFASFYSSFYLSSSSPLALLSNINRGKRKQASRNILVTIQYTISIMLIICCVVIFCQMRFISKSDKGFNEKDVLIVNLNPKTSATRELIKNRFSNIPGVISVSVSGGGIPGVGFESNGYMPEGVEKPIMADAAYIDENFFSTMGISVIEGRNFRKPGTEGKKAIINQTFKKFLGWENPSGKKISRNGTDYEVIGVVKDFNTSTFHSKIEPLFISNISEMPSFDYINIKYLPANLPVILQSTESILKEIDPQSPYEYTFLEDAIAKAYSSEQKLYILFLVFAVIAIFISSLGLFGLATFSTQSRIKEISIRKINGATISDVFRKFNIELLKWILISFLIASPIGYFVMNKLWLSGFAYKMTITIWHLIFSGLFALAIGLITVSWASTKAAWINPALTLRTE
jgi:putative ABC transport system permease protein